MGDTVAVDGRKRGTDDTVAMDGRKKAQNGRASHTRNTKREGVVLSVPRRRSRAGSRLSASLGSSHPDVFAGSVDGDRRVALEEVHEVGVRDGADARGLSRLLLLSLGRGARACGLAWRRLESRGPDGLDEVVLVLWQRCGQPEAGEVIVDPHAREPLVDGEEYLAGQVGLVRVQGHHEALPDQPPRVFGRTRVGVRGVSDAHRHAGAPDSRQQLLTAPDRHLGPIREPPVRARRHLGVSTQLARELLVRAGVKPGRRRDRAWRLGGFRIPEVIHHAL